MPRRYKWSDEDKIDLFYRQQYGRKREKQAWLETECEWLIENAPPSFLDSETQAELAKVLNNIHKSAAKRRAAEQARALESA